MATWTGQEDFGRRVLGPIFADFALRLWVFLSNLDQADDCAVLFCARGGLRLKLIYERFLAASELASPVQTRDFMVSRIAAVRSALVANCRSAHDQIGYEMRSRSLREVAVAVGGFDPVTDTALLPLWEVPYAPERLAEVMSSQAGAAVWASVQQQAALLSEHVEICLGGRQRAILCDTGLSGSTMQLLEGGMPQVSWGCALFARSNYKRMSTAHYQRTFGLSVQADGYSPLNVRSSILRYWHLIESTLEPDLASVTRFDRVNGVPRSNLEIDGWQDKLAPRAGEIFAGVIDYIEALRPRQAASQIAVDVDGAYVALRRAIVWPTPADVDILALGARSLDFGRVGSMSAQVCEPGLRNALRGSLWREGAVTLTLPNLRLPVLACVEAAYATRWAYHALSR
jgi:hypothetical protein